VGREAEVIAIDFSVCGWLVGFTLRYAAGNVHDLRLNFGAERSKVANPNFCLSSRSTHNELEKNR